MSYRKSIAWRQKSEHWTDNEWPYANGANWTVTAKVLQSKNKVEGKPHHILRKIMIASGESTLFGLFLWSIFRSPVFTSVFFLKHMILILYFTHVWLRVDLIFALLMDIWWFFFGFGSCKWKRKKQGLQVVFKGRQTFLKIWFFNHFYESHWHFLKWYSSHKFT